MSKALLAALLTCTTVAQAQSGPPLSDWQAVSSRSSGEMLVVKLMQGKVVKGRIQDVSQNSVSLQQGDKSVALMRDDIVSVSVLGQKKSGAKGALLGAVIGGGAGAGIGAAATGNGNSQCCLSSGQTRAIGAGFGGAIGLVGGSLVGYFSGRNQHNQTIIYRAPR